MFFFYSTLFSSGIYLTTVMAMTSVTVIMTVFVLNLHHRGPNNKPIPNWLRRLFLEKRTKNKSKRTSRRRSASNFHPSDSTSGNSTRLYGDPSVHVPEEAVPRSESSQYIRNVSLRLTIENLAQELKSDLDNYDHVNNRGEAGSNRYNHQERNSSDSTRRNRRFNSQYDHIGSRYSRPYRDVMDQYEAVTSPLLTNDDSASSKTNEEILSVLRSIIRRYEQEDHQDLVIQEWRQVAVCVDRILFWVFFFGTLGSTLIVLVIAPITRFI